MKIFILNILTLSSLVTSSLSMDIDEIKTKLESGSDRDFMDVAHYIQFDVIKRGKRTKDEMIEIAHILYEFRDHKGRTMVKGDDVVYSIGRGWVVDQMARLTSYEDSLPESLRNQYLPSGSRIDPLGNLTFDVTAQNEFLLWYKENFTDESRSGNDSENSNVDASGEETARESPPNHTETNRDDSIVDEASGDVS